MTFVVVIYVWSGGLIDSRSVVGVYIYHLGSHSDASWGGGNCVCCRLADASSGPAVELGRLEREHVKRYMGNKLFISYGLELIYSITQRENQLEY